MSSWSSRRKLTYAGIVIITVLALIVFPLFYFFYKAPTCSDMKQNSDETGVDCGGSCARLCQSSFLPPRIEWGGAKFERLANGLYNAASYIVNPNITGAALDVPYKISFYDDAGLLITERKGKMNLYPHRNSLAFQTAIRSDRSVPVKATFEFTKSPEWFKSSDSLDGIAVIDKKYEDNNEGSSFEVTLENKTLLTYRDVEVSAILYDIGDNVIGFSQTKIDEIAPKGGREIAPFTWPINRNNKVISEEILFNIVPQNKK